MNTDWLVFTDLDGTLLDHHSYDFTPALPALQRLQALAIPVIAVSSKTLAELEHYATALALDGPLVAENGSVIRLPDAHRLITPPAYAELRRYLQQLRASAGFAFIGFGDMSPAEVIEYTGLPQDAAALAMQRLASEPILWRDSTVNLHRFEAEVRAKGLCLLRGGRFIHVLGDTDKGCAVRRLADWYRSRGRDKLTTLALGDSDNDRDMLLSADIPVIIRKHDGSHLELPPGRGAIISESAGPAGWNQVINSLLNREGGWG